jgi:DNA (cytosine-5)-methyltransferase 1
MKGISLFSNIGIGEFGLPNDVEIVIANELLKNRADLYQKLHPNTKVIQGNILDKDVFDSLIEESKKHKIDFLLATPPCQGMSIAGKKQNDDPRNALILPALEYIKIVQPSFIVFENVEAMKRTTIDGKTIPNVIIDTVSELGYKSIQYKIVDMADYGIPQFRKRMFFLISKEKAWDFPSKLSQKITVKDAIDHLPSLESGESCEEEKYKWHFSKKHSPNHIEWMRHTKSGDTAFNNPIHFPKKENGDRIKAFMTSYKRMSPHKPAPTITMGNGSISSQNNVHYGREKKLDDGSIVYTDSRVLTILELLILMTIPIDKFNLPLDTNECLIREVIGEGVPSKMMSRLFETCPYRSM